MVFRYRGGRLMLIDALGAPPPGVDEALALVDGLDDALIHGLTRVDEERAGHLEALADAFAGSPLADRVADAVGKIIAGTVTDEHLIAIAGARIALLGATHDTLLAQLDRAHGRTRVPSPAFVGSDEVTKTAAGEHVLSSSRGWLRELAIAGWRGVDHELAAAGTQTLRPLLDDPRHRRIAVLLDGLAGELRAVAPVATLKRIPARRWADLWCRCLLLSHGSGEPVPAAAVTGRLMILGVDLHEHPTIFRAQVHGLLDVAGGVRLIRTSVAAAKVDTITGPSAWRLLADFPVLLSALAGRHSIDVTDLTLTSAGDLIWCESQARPGEPVDPFALARVQLAGAVAGSVDPLDRHPVMIAEPVLLEGYTANGDCFDLGGCVLPVDLDRMPAAGPLTPALLAASAACLGLLRWDAGRWSVQPLAVQATVRKKPVSVHTADWAQGPTETKAAKAEAVAGTAVTVLRERAGKLLRPNVSSTP
jgi:hypothetical protein